ncbi:MAG: C25 family cysteine peptidase, partial [Candidatus Delongbacteria bacterium]|nr:C25 family cysteine peptidase [Candidatus Delongbacteria bacterium]
MKKIMSMLAVCLIATISFGDVSRGFVADYQRVSPEEMEVKIATDFTLSVVEKDGVKYSKISGAGSIFTNEKGYAELPYHSSAVQLKDDKNVSMKFRADDFEDFVLEYPLLPSRGVVSRSQNIDEIPYEIVKESVKNEWYPGKISEVTEPFVMRDVRGTHIIVYPYQYNASERTLRVYKSVTVTLTDNEEPATNALFVKPAKIAQELSGMYKSIFLNYNETKALTIGELGEILVIYTPNNGALTAIQPWIDWKRQKGYKVHTLEKANGTDLYVTQDIKNQYLANTNILYAQIVGDFPNLKSQVLASVTTPGSQDPMLGCTVGTDKYVEVVVGRFSVSTDVELANQINKAIDYEKNPTMAATWYEKGIGIASNEGVGAGDDGEGDQAHSDIIINNKLLPFTYASVSTAYQANNVPKATILGYVNDGRSLINYTGHGSYDCFQSIYGGYLYNADVNTLTNGTKLPFVVSVACLVGCHEYTSGICFAEAWLRKVNGGAVAGWFSSISQPWLPPMRGQDYFNDILKGGYDYSTQPGDGINVTEQRTTAGTICFNASNLMLTEAPTDASTQDTAETWTIFGDVSLQLRTDPPKAISSSTTTLLPSNFSTTVTSGGSPVSGAWACLYQNGTNYSAYTNSSGYVSIDHDFAIASDVTVTITGFNLETKQSVMMVTGELGGNFALDKTSMPYGNVTVGGSSTQQFTITNSHSTETIIGEITTITGYTVSDAVKAEKNVFSYAVPTNSSKTFDLVFSPSSQTTYSGNIVITSSDTSHPTNNIAVSGTGAYPDISLPAGAGATAAPEGSVTDSFVISNTGTAGLNYSLSNAYVGYQSAGATVHTNDFQAGLVYADTGTQSWATATGGTWNSNSTCAKVSAYTAQQNQTRTGILTSDTFAGTDGLMYLDFDQTATLTNSTIAVKYSINDGSTWSDLYTSSASVTGHQHILIPNYSSSMKIQFNTSLKNVSGSSWSIDNILIREDDVPYTWLTFNSPTTGLVAGSGANTINMTYDAAGLS